jgi:tRNA(Ile)-lysidine synthase
MIHINKQILPESFSLAISGGNDSIACAHLLKTLGYDFKAVHYNHNQREQNELMVDGCKKFCDDFGIELTVGKCVVKYTKNIEDSLREERLSFFDEIGGSIVMCHHLGDCVEQYLMNCLKGCPEYKPINEITRFDKFTILRPFIRNSKFILEDWVERKELSEYIVVDETNTDSKYERNWIRNEIIPKIEERRGLERVVLKKFYM